jgi:hypothetical protein
MKRSLFHKAFQRRIDDAHPQGNAEFRIGDKGAYDLKAIQFAILENTQDEKFFQGKGGRIGMR